MKRTVFRRTLIVTVTLLTLLATWFQPVATADSAQTPQSVVECSLDLENGDGESLEDTILVSTRPTIPYQSACIPSHRLRIPTQPYLPIPFKPPRS